MEKPLPRTSQPQKIAREFTNKDFQFIEQIGTGKFGIVYKAKELTYGKIVVIKIIPKKKIDDVQMYERIRNQIQVHSRLKFLHICELYCYFHDTNNLYLVLEYCSNSSLYYPVRIQNRYFNQQQIAKFMYQLLFALDYLQKRFVIHRDIKLQNLLLDDNFNMKLSDFGCCIHTKEKRKSFVGTLDYISPEMLACQQHNQKVDIYSVGIVFYELFYLQSPFKGETQEETFKRISENSIHFNEKIRVVPELAKDLIIQMLCKDPAKRPTPQKALEHNFFKRYYIGQIYTPEAI